MSCKPQRPSTAPRQPWLWAVLLCAALLGSQSLGLLHRMVHPQGGLRLLQTVSTTAAPAAVSKSGDFAGHQENSAQCQLFDQLCQADGLTTQSLSFTAAVPHGLQPMAALSSASPAPFWRTRARAPPARA